jgi:uncharacterized protein YerC
MSEIWKKVPQFENYSINSEGKLKNTKTNRLLSTKSVNSEGYVLVCLSNNGKIKTLRFHRLLAECFIPKIIGKDFVNHKNGIKTDNRLENLEWCTKKENAIHAYKNNICNNNHIRKYDKSIDVEIINMRKKRYTYKEIAKKLNISFSKINNVLNKKNW